MKYVLLALLVFANISNVYAAESKKFVPMPNPQAQALLSAQLSKPSAYEDETGSAYHKSRCTFTSGRARSCF
jgi:hypothetical protein